MISDGFPHVDTYLFGKDDSQNLKIIEIRYFQTITQYLQFVENIEIEEKGDFCLNEITS